MSALAIRRLRSGDQELGSALIGSRSPEAYRLRLDAQARGDAVCLIAWLDGRPVGFVAVAFHDDRSPDELVEARGFALVDYLFVEEPYRRRGIGRALMVALEAEARAAGMPGVILDTGTGESFAAARALYRSLGYADRGGRYLGGWSDPDRPGVHLVDELTVWVKAFEIS